MYGKITDVQWKGSTIQAKEDCLSQPGKLTNQSRGPDSVQVSLDAWCSNIQPLNVYYLMAASVSEKLTPISVSHTKFSPNMSAADGISAILTKNVAQKLCNARTGVRGVMTPKPLAPK